MSPVRELHNPKRDASSVAHGAPVRRDISHGIQRRGASPHGDNDYPHVMTGVDKLRGEGYTGSGIRLAVIDSGIDYKHPALGGCFGKGCLVEYGWNLLTNTSDPWEGKAGHGIFEFKALIWITPLTFYRNSRLWNHRCPTQSLWIHWCRPERDPRSLQDPWTATRQV